MERERDIFADSERIEERAGLKNHGDTAANRDHLIFVPAGDVLPGDDDAAGVRLREIP